jgi:gamma-glutamylcyclotransferase (GGCT)/AIG2-like uncharacterized protein YtfP
MPLYFAYGSNMSTARLQTRAASASPLGIAVLEGHDLRFHKQGQDGTGKADAYHTGSTADAVWGVLFDMTDGDLRTLDGFEGSQYARALTNVRRNDGVTTEAWVYMAKPDALQASLVPSEQYLRYVLDGAREHELPASYISRLAGIRAR